jgi:hypothetical protein
LIVHATNAAHLRGRPFGFWELIGGHRPTEGHGAVVREHLDCARVLDVMAQFRPHSFDKLNVIDGLVVQAHAYLVDFSASVILDGLQGIAELTSTWFQRASCFVGGDVPA